MEKNNTRKIIVLFSGGQDSTTVLCWAKQHYQKVIALGIDYGQRHKIEMEQAQKIADSLKVPLHTIPFVFYQGLSKSSSLLSRELELPEVPTSGIPSTFVPGRNLFFLTFAAALGFVWGISHLAIGANEVDFSGYPDCRENFLRSAEKTLSLALAKSIIIKAPLLKMSKKEIWLFAQKLGCLSLIIKETHTCYQGERKKKYAWGYGCGKCAACTLRKEGFLQAFGNPK